MAWILSTLFFIFATIMSIIYIIVKIVTSKSIKRMDVVENATFLLLGSRKKFTNGYGIGLIKNQVSCKNGTTRFQFHPMDYDQGEFKPIPEVQVVMCKNEFIRRFARGEGDSDRREIIKLVDRFPSDMPEKMMDTEEGKEMAKEGQKAFIKKTFGDWTKAGDEALYELMLEESRIGITKSALAKIKEENILLRKMNMLSLKEELENKKS